MKHSGRPWWLLGAVAAVGVAVARFARKQNRGDRVGGAISLPKTLWLNYTLVSWFLVPAALLRLPALGPGTRRALSAHLASFGARGAAELWMLYRTRSWRVAYGVGHDALDLALVGALMGSGPPVSPEDATARAHLRAVQLTLVAEIAFALLFHRAVEGRTQGADAIYFAAHTPEFRKINRLTTVVDTVVYAQLGWTLLRLYGRPNRDHHYLEIR